MRIVKAVRDYLAATLQIELNPKSWKGAKGLPFFLHNLYDFYEVVLIKQACVFIVAKTNVEVTPVTIKKHLETVQQIFPGLCIFVQEGISAYNRKRLIEQHVPFVIPGNQIYLPDLGIDLREYFQKLRTHAVKSFTPGTQAVIIYALVYGIEEQFSPTELARKLHYSPMTMTRVFDELQATGIGQVIHKGRQRWWVYGEGKRQLWEQALPLMRTPVKIKTFLSKTLPLPPILTGLQAGSSALSCCSMLQPPKLDVFAIGQDKWVTLKDLGWEEQSIPELAACEIEVWKYDPLLLTKENRVDPFSLYLSLITDADERTELALEEMMEKIQW